jgi:arylsulfatase A-like enzyme
VKFSAALIYFMKTRVTLLIIFFILACFGSAQEKPNIVIIYSDDPGWMDTEYQTGGAVPTPTLDRMIEQGMHFTNAYTNAANCQPSRAYLLSGNYTPRHQ